MIVRKRKKCNQCNKIKAVSEFNNTYKNKDRKENKCIECSRSNMKKIINICALCDTEFVTIYKTKYCNNCKERDVKCSECDNYFKWTTRASNRKTCSKDCKAKRTNRLNNTNKRDTFLILCRDEFRCIYCGFSSIENRADLHVDHIYPKSKGGEDIASNLVTSCKKCNLSKHDTILNGSVAKRIYDVVSERNKHNNIREDQIIKM